MKRVLSLGKVVVAQGKNSLTGARKVVDDFVGVKELKAAQQNVKLLKKKISSSNAKRSEYELELAEIRKRISTLNTENTRLKGLLDANNFEVQMLQHQLTQAMVLEKQKQHQLVQKGRLAKSMLTVMLYLLL